MGLVQRAIEEAGVPTVSVTMLPEITRKIRAPRAVHVRFPLGHPLGYPGQPFLQRRILEFSLAQAAAIREPGTIVDAGIGGDSGENCAVCGPPPSG